MEIRGMVEGIQADTRRVSDSMDEGVVSAQGSVENAEKTGAAINTVLATISSINEQSGHIFKSTLVQIDSSKKLAQRSDNLLSICQQTARLAKESSSCSHSEAATSKQLRQLLNDYQS